MNSRVMRIIVMFDLPVMSKKDKKEYMSFRKYLINEGYDMIQYSVYGRLTRNHDDAKKIVGRLRKNLPKKGSVRAMIVTEKQYCSMMILVGEKTATEDFLTPKELIEL